MLPANLHLRELYDTTVEFFALRTPTLSRGVDSSEEEQRVLTPVPDPVARLTQECASLRERLLDADSRADTCTCSSSSASRASPLPSMRRDDETKKELARTRSEVVKLEERCRMLERTLKETKDMLRIRDAEVERMREAALQQKADRRVTFSDDARGDERGRAGSGNNNRDSKLVEDPGNLLIPSVEEEQAQRRSAEAFMTRTDSWSGAQVLQAVHDLNSEVLQFCAAATELCSFERKSSSSSSGKTAKAMQDTEGRLGRNMARLLANRDHSQDPLLVQLALQGCLATCISRSLSAFCIGFPTKQDNILSQIYAHMYAAVPQPTSSRWRALTHRHIHVLYPYMSEYSVNELAETIYRWSSDVLVISGGSSSDKLSLSTRDGLRSRFGEQVRRIARTVTRLEVVMKQEIMSTTFDVAAVDYGDAFDPRKMSDAFGDYGTSRGSTLTTSELGLRCTTRRSAKESSTEAGGVESRYLLQPKVVLDSVLDFVDPR